MIRPSPLVVLPIVCLLLAGCAEGKPAGGAAPTPIPGETERPEILYPTHEGPPHGDAGLAGRLEIHGNCLLVLGGKSVILPVWHSSSSFETDGSGGEILDEDGKVVARVGENLRNIAETAHLPKKDVEQVAGQDLPERCGDREITSYMIVGPFGEEAPL